MPTYEYACKDCGEHLEVVQSFKDDALTECPNCSGSLRKVFSAAGIIFKGSGWHVKDYASSSNRSAREGGASGEGDGDRGSTDGAGSKDAGSDAAATGSGSDAGSESKASKDTASPSSDGAGKGTKARPAASSSSTPEKKSA